MKLSVPFYYDKFRCIADKCPDSCCVGWEIAVDDDTLRYYRTVGGEIGKRLQKSIKDGVFQLTDGERCPFLNGNGLCDIITALGEDKLCKICARHPRFAEQYCEDTEIGLGLSCPECARIICESDLPDSYIVSRDTEDEIEVFGYTENDDDADEYRALLSLREALYRIVRSAPTVYDACVQSLDLALFAQEAADGYGLAAVGDATADYAFSPAETEDFDGFTVKDLLSVFSDAEAVDDNWQSLFEKAMAESPRNIRADDMVLRRIFAYFLFRYLLKSLCDGDIYGKIKLCVVAVLLCGTLMTVGFRGLPPYRIAALLSKQVEYSEECLGVLYDAFDENDAFDYDHLVYLLRKQ